MFLFFYHFRFHYIRSNFVCLFVCLSLVYKFYTFFRILFPYCRFVSGLSFGIILYIKIRRDVSRFLETRHLKTLPGRQSFNPSRVYVLFFKFLPIFNFPFLFNIISEENMKDCSVFNCKKKSVNVQVHTNVHTNEYTHRSHPHECPVCLRRVSKYEFYT